MGRWSRAIQTQFLVLLVLAFSEMAPATELNWGGEISNQYEKVYRFNSNGPLSLTDHFRMKAGVDLKIKKSDNLNGYLKVETKKYWNSWMVQNRPAAGTDNVRTENPYASDQVNLDSAFFEYRFLEGFRFSGGRFNSTEENSARFPKLVFGRQVDGMLFSKDWGLSESSQLQFGAGYVPYLLLNYNYQSTAAIIKPRYNGGAADAENLAPMAFVWLGLESKNLSWVEKLNVHLQYRWMNYLRFPDGSYEGVYTTQSNLTIFLNTVALGIQMRRLAGSPLDLNLNLLLSSLKSQGEVRATAGPGSPKSLGGFGTNSTDETMDGNGILVSGEYQFFWESLMNPKLGLEFFTSTKFYFYSDSEQDDSTAFYETKGQAFQFYWKQPLDKDFFVQAGLRRQNFRHGPTRFGAIADDSTTVDNWNLKVAMGF